MNSTVRYLSPAEAANQLGVSAKALRLYEQRNLVTPSRNAAGWRSYGPADMQRAADVVALRALGFSLAQVVRVIDGETEGLEPALAAHQTVLEARVRELAGTIDRVRGLRADLERGQAPSVQDLKRLGASAAGLSVEFDLPWPWGGELFKLRDIKPLNYIVGPLSSGKTRLAIRLAEVIPDARFVALDRAENGSAAALLQEEPALQARVDQKLAWLVEDGATASAALIALLAHLEAEGPAVRVVDMLEQGLDAATQQAVAAYLRHRRPGGRTLFLMTRSSAMLDLASMDADGSIILCPANHSPPTLVAPYAGAPGYEAVATCLAAPEVRARTEGVMAWLPKKREGRVAL